MDVNNKKDDKLAGDIIKIAGTKGIPVREFSRHDLNMMTDNKVTFHLLTYLLTHSLTNSLLTFLTFSY